MIFNEAKYSTNNNYYYINILKVKINFSSFIKDFKDKNKTY
jgi:hypothetical protein